MLGPLYKLIEEKKELDRQIIQYGSFLSEDVELLMSVKGISPLMALAFLADVGDISRFPSIRRLNAYLGLVPVTRSSGKREFQGHIIRCSRHLTRTLFTQIVKYIGPSSPELSQWYQEVRARRGVGRGRIAMIRKSVKIMRRMLLTREQYRWTDKSLYQTKLANYRRILKKGMFELKIPA